MSKHLVLVLIAAAGALALAGCSDEAERTTWRPVVRPVGSELTIDVAVGPCDTFDRLDVDEAEGDVTLDAYVQTQVKKVCDGPISYEQRTVELAAPIGDRQLLGCNPPDAVYGPLVSALDPGCGFPVRH